MINVSLPLYLLLVANAALIVAATFALMRAERAINEPKEFWASPTGQAMRDAQSGRTEHRELLRRVEGLRAAVCDIQKQANEAPAERVVDISLGRAMRLAKRGASVDELAKNCGLNRGEAELMRRLHAESPADSGGERSAS